MRKGNYMKVSQIKSKVAAKVAKGKAKIAAKCGKSSKCAAVALFLSYACCLLGCATSDPSSRSTAATYGDIIVRLDHACSNVVTVTIGDGAIASADSSGSTETTTATPTQTTRIEPKTDVNTTGGRTAGVLESIVGAFGTWLATPSGKTAAADAAKCADGSCSPCADGNCTTGACSDCEK